MREGKCTHQRPLKSPCKMRFCCQDFINAGQVEYYFLPRVAPVTVPLMQVWEAHMGGFGSFILCCADARWAGSVVHGSGCFASNHLQASPSAHRNSQVTLYDLCLRHSAGLHTFIAFIDVDEYLVPSPADRPKKLDGLLREFEGFAAVAVNWRLLGTSGEGLGSCECGRSSTSLCIGCTSVWQACN